MGILDLPTYSRAQIDALLEDAGGNADLRAELDGKVDSTYSLPEETSKSLRWEWKAPSRAAFGTVFWGSPNDGGGRGTTNHVVHMGFNPEVHHGDGEPGKPAFYMGFEDGWWDGSTMGAEWYVSYWSSDRSVELLRPFYTRVLYDSPSQQSATSYCDIGTDGTGSFNVSTRDFEPLFTVAGTAAGGSFMTLQSDGNATFVLDGGDYGPFLVFKNDGRQGFALTAPSPTQLVVSDPEGRAQASFTAGDRSHVAVTDFLSVVRVGSSLVVGQGPLPTEATDGFLYVPTCAGTPTGTPTPFPGAAPLVFDTTNRRLYVHEDGTWHHLAETA